MAKSGNSTGKMNIRIADEETATAIKTIIAYEAVVRGRTIGQTCSELIMEAADIESYPAEVRERLNEIAAESERRAVAKSLEMSEIETPSEPE